jgi:mannose-6-phosphate isomerase-like protein (cupin superfamily)
VIKQPNGGAVFPIASVMVRDWGTETVVASCEHYTFKRISMGPKKQGGLQFHHKKDETGTVIDGSAKVEYDPGTGVIQHKWIARGDTVRFPPGAVHRMTAGDNGIVYIEASTPYYNDRCHVEKSYGFEEETGGLPSTKLEDVIKVPPGSGNHE